MACNDTDCLRSILSELQAVEIPAEGVGGEGGRILREKLIESRILYNTLYAQQPVGDRG